MKRINCCWGVFGWVVGPGFPIKIFARHWGSLSLIYFWIANSYTYEDSFHPLLQFLGWFSIPLAMPLRYNCVRQMQCQWNRLCAGMLEFILVFSARYAGHRNCCFYHLCYHHFPIQVHYWIYHQYELWKRRIWINQFSWSWNEIKTFFLDHVYFASLFALHYQVSIEKCGMEISFYKWSECNTIIVIHTCIYI